jgi:hypothetical protein
MGLIGAFTYCDKNVIFDSYSNNFVVLKFQSYRSFKYGFRYG